MVNTSRDLQRESGTQHSSSSRRSNKLAFDTSTNDASFIISNKEYKARENLKSVSSLNSKKTSYVELYKPIYIASHSNNVQGEVSYEEGDEFELIEVVDKNYLRTIHLRTNTDCTLHQTCLYLDLQTPLRLGSNDRGVIQRCLLQYNTFGTYLIRRSKNEPNAFVLSISQSLSLTNTEDWHYLIYTNPLNHCFYFAQESKLHSLSFPTFQKLIQNRKVLEIIPLSTVIPFRIDFEEEDLWHIPRRHLTFEHRIGNGAFGEVWRAQWKNGHRSIPVAIKKFYRSRHDQSSIESSLREIETMKTLRNNYLVTLYGITEDRQTNETYLVTELMENGDLKTWLEYCLDLPDEKLISSFAYDICCGMSFLEQQSHVHRDLACRNLLLGANRQTIKIADFGLSTLISKDDCALRDEAYLQKLPVRWTAPEVLRNRRVYSIKSDVWSFGIVLIEIWLKGRDPYPKEKEFDAIRTLVKNGYIHEKPFQCPNQFYKQLILPCLRFKSHQRPNFRSLVDLLRKWNKEENDNDNEHVPSPYVEYSS